MIRSVNGLAPGFSSAHWFSWQVTRIKMARLLVVCVLVSALFSCGSPEPDIVDRFFKFIDDFRKPYKKGTDEFMRRFEIFKV